MKINFNKNLNKIEPYYIAVLPEKLKRMHANESDRPILPTNILMKNVDDNLNFYPEKQAVKLVEKASQFYQIDAKNIIATNGSDEGIDLCIRTFCNPNDIILVGEPTFSMYQQYAEIFGVKVKKVSLIEDKNCFIFNEDVVIDNARKIKAKMIFLSNPLSNIGELISKEKLLKIIKSLPNTIIIIDETYIDFTNQKSSLYDLKKYKNLVVLRTFSKFFGLAGIRLGFIFTNLTNEIMKVKSPYNVNSITCQIGINVFENLTDDTIKSRQNEVLEKRKKLEKWLKTFNEVETIFKSETNFLFMKLSCKSNVFADKLEKEYNIKIKTMSGKFENYCRISVL